MINDEQIPRWLRDFYKAMIDDGISRFGYKRIFCVCLCEWAVQVHCKMAIVGEVCMGDDAALQVRRRRTEAALDAIKDKIDLLRIQAKTKGSSVRAVASWATPSHKKGLRRSSQIDMTEALIGPDGAWKNTINQVLHPDPETEDQEYDTNFPQEWLDGAVEMVNDELCSAKQTNRDEVLIMFMDMNEDSGFPRGRLKTVIPAYGFQLIAEVYGEVFVYVKEDSRCILMLHRPFCIAGDARESTGLEQQLQRLESLAFMHLVKCYITGEDPREGPDFIAIGGWCEIFRVGFHFNARLSACLARHGVTPPSVNAFLESNLTRTPDDRAYGPSRKGQRVFHGKVSDSRRPHDRLAVEQAICHLCRAGIDGATLSDCVRAAHRRIESADGDKNKKASRKRLILRQITCPAFHAQVKAAFSSLARNSGNKTAGGRALKEETERITGVIKESLMLGVDVNFWCLKDSDARPSGPIPATLPSASGDHHPVFDIVYGTYKNRFNKTAKGNTSWKATRYGWDAFREEVDPQSDPNRTRRLAYAQPPEELTYYRLVRIVEGERAADGGFKKEPKKKEGKKGRQSHAEAARKNAEERGCICYVQNTRLTTASAIWREYKVGIDGGPSLEWLENNVTHWRSYNVGKAAFGRRSGIYLRMEQMIESGVTEEAAIAELQTMLDAHKAEKGQLDLQGFCKKLRKQYNLKYPRPKSKPKPKPEEGKGEATEKKRKCPNQHPPHSIVQLTRPSSPGEGVQHKKPRLSPQKAKPPALP